MQDTIPSRYALESDDSEDEMGQNAYPGQTGKIKRGSPPAVVELVWNGDGGSLQAHPTFIAVGEAGLAWAAGLNFGPIVAEVHLNEETVSVISIIASI